MKDRGRALLSKRQLLLKSPQQARVRHVSLRIKDRIQNFILLKGSCI